MAGFDLLVDQAAKALTDPRWRMAVQVAMTTIAIEVIEEPVRNVPGQANPRSRVTGKRRGLANRVMDNPIDPLLISQVALAVAADPSITEDTTPEAFLQAVRDKWDAIARVNPEDANTPELTLPESTT